MIEFDVTKLGLDDTVTCRLFAQAALEWLRDNTTLDVSDPKELPAVASLFILKFCESMEVSAGVSSESLGGMSQSFSSESMQSVLWGVAWTLLSSYLKPTAKFTPAERTWTYGRKGHH